MRKPRKPKELKVITKEIVEDNDSSGDENKKPKPKVDKVCEMKRITFYKLVRNTHAYILRLYSP